MNHAPKTTEVFDDLIAALTEIRDGYVLDERRFTNPLDVAEGFRYVGQAIAAASELFIEGDPEHPRFASIVTPARKLQGDNPDAIYHFARVTGANTYRVSGRIEQQCYTSFTVHGAADDGGMAGPLLGDVNDRDFEVGADGSYEVVFSADQPGGDTPGNWVELHPDAHSIIVRSYYQLEQSAQNNSAIDVDIDIRCLSVEGPPPPLDDATLSGRMAEAVAFLRQVTVGQNLPDPDASPSVPFVSEIPNDVAKPFSFRDSGMPVPGAADIFYSMGRWNLGADEALVMTGRLPAGPFVNVMLWNRHMQTLDYRDRQSSLNGAQIDVDADGTYRIVVADRPAPPAGSGITNWLDTGGHPEGTIFWRFLLPETDPEKPHCEVVTMDSLT